MMIYLITIPSQGPIVLSDKDSARDKVAELRANGIKVIIRYRGKTIKL